MLADFSKHLQIGIPNPSSSNNANKSMKNKTRRSLETCYFEVGQNALWSKERDTNRARGEEKQGQAQWFKVSLEVLLSSGLRYLDLIFITSFYKTNIGNKRRKEAFKDHLIYHLCDGCTGHSSHPNLPSSKNANVLLYYYYGLSKEPVTSLDCFYFVWKQWMVGQDTESAKKAKK